LEGIKGPFDLAFDLGCFHTIQQDGKPAYLRQLKRILAPKGFWLMYGFLIPDASQARHGLLEVEIHQISSQLTLLSRREGFDDHKEKSSAWFLFQKQPSG
jgi:hypothetical protein